MALMVLASLILMAYFLATDADLSKRGNYIFGVTFFAVVFLFLLFFVGFLARNKFYKVDTQTLA